MIRRMLASTLVVTVLWTTTWAVAPVHAQGSVPESLSREEALKRLGEFMALIEELRSQIDRSQFDLEALLEKLDYDGDKIIKFVKEEIYFEQYPGLLRGAQGTLTGRAGNALDQSVLLATLLRAAGYESRIVRGDLERSHVDRLIQQLGAPRSADASLGNASRMRQVIDAIERVVEVDSPAGLRGAGPGAESDFRSSEQFRLLEHHTELIRDALRRDGVSLGSQSWLSNLHDEARDYFWVEHRAGPTDKWIPTHPAFGHASPPVDCEASAIFNSDVPSELHHRVRLQSFLEQRNGDRQLVRPIMQPWEQPVANLTGSAITYSHVSRGLPSNKEEGGDSGLPESTLFFPSVNGSIPPGGRAFDLLGNLVDPTAAASYMAGVFQEVGRNFAAAAEELHGLRRTDVEGARALLALERVWLEITLIGPGGAEERFLRVLAQPAVEERRLLSLPSQQVSLTIMTSELPSSLLLDRALELLLELGASVGVGQGTLIADQDTNRPPFGASYYFWLAARGRQMTDEVLAYYPEPAVLAWHRGVVLEGRIFEGFDIVNNGRRAFKIGKGSIVPSAEGALRLGLWEAVSETSILPPGQKERFDVFRAFADSMKDGQVGEVSVLRTEREIEASGLSGTAKQLALSDLSGGNVIIVARATLIGDSEPSAWWSVNPESGEILGRITPTGWGGVNEYELFLDLLKWLSCSMNVRAKCEEQVAWAGASLKFAIDVTLGWGLDTPPQEYDWWDYWDLFNEHPTVIWLKMLLERRAGISLDGASKDDFVQRCWEKTVGEPEEEGGCGEHPIPPY